MVIVLGWLLLSRISAGLLDAKQHAALDEARAGLTEAQARLDAADTTDAASTEALIQGITTQLSNRRRAAAAVPGAAARLGERAGPAGVQQQPGRQGAACRPALREAVTSHPAPVLHVHDDAVHGRHDAGAGLRRGRTAVGPRGRRLRAVLPVPAHPGAGHPGAGPAHADRRRPAARRAARRRSPGWSPGRWSTPVRMARADRRAVLGRPARASGWPSQGEDDLARLATSFNHMAASLQRQIRQLEDLSRVQRRFVSDVSHELRTPLTTVRMAADVLHEARAGVRPGHRPVGRAAADPAGPVRVAAHRPAGDQPVRRRRGGARGRARSTCATIVRRVGRRRGAAGRARAAASISVVTAEPALPGRVRPAPGRAGPAQPDRQRDRARRGPADRRHRRRSDDDAVAVAVRDHGVGLRPGESLAGVQPVLAGRPGPGPDDRRHRARPVDRARGRPAARRLAAGVGPARATAPTSG